VRDNRPVPYVFKHIPTLWADYTTGVGVLSNGQLVRPKIGQRRKNPNLADMLDTAASTGVTRIMFTGKVPPADREGGRHWMMARTEGWSHGWYGSSGEPMGHWLSNPPTGRYERQQTGQRVEVRVAAEWFGDTPLNPRQARDAWDATEYLIGTAFKDPRSKDPKNKEPMKLGKSPAATGRNLWAASLPKDLNLTPVTPDIAAILHSTSGQHHLEHLVAGKSFSTHEDCLPLVDPAKTPTLEQFAYVDGRFMYASLCRELGTGPGVWLNRAGAWQMANDDPYARARVRVRFRVPKDWNHVGILGVQHRNVSDGWFYPNKPGAQHETWADLSEVFIAQKYGWEIDFQEAIQFATQYWHDDKQVKFRPLDNFATRIIKIRETVDSDPEMDLPVKKAVGAALRAIMVATIGSFASRGKGSTQVAFNPQDVPPQYLQSMERRSSPDGEIYIYKVPAALTDQETPFYHPEFAAQVWARGRAKVLLSPTALGSDTGGALTVPANTLLGINGDAIYTTYVPTWALPTNYDGGDDGRVGRLRLQGYLEKVKTPATLEDRNRLRAKSAQTALETAFFENEFDSVEE
jgi:hypothetical protein